MRTLAGYIRKNLKWMVLLLLLEGIFAAILLWNHISVGEVIYGIGVGFFCTIVLVVWDYARIMRKCRRLERIAASSVASLEALPEADGPLESKYQRLIQVRDENYRNRLEDGERRHRDMVDYFSTWIHQIKTPIAAMHLLLQGQRQGLENLDVADENAMILPLQDNSEMETQLFYMQQYVEMTLQYIRLGADETDYVIRSTSLDKIIREAIHKYAKLFIRKQITLQYDETKLQVITDEKWLEFVIEQILSNALKYTKQGGIHIYVEDARLVIADTGIGIAPEDLPRIFEKGYTGYNGHNDKSSTGIGLYLCKRTLERLTHNIQVTSTVGEGTRVIIGGLLESHKEDHTWEETL